MYGSTNSVSQTLRVFENGQLKTDFHNSEELLPQNSAAGCQLHTEYGMKCQMDACFLAGLYNLGILFSTLMIIIL